MATQSGQGMRNQGQMPGGIFNQKPIGGTTPEGNPVGVAPPTPPGMAPHGNPVYGQPPPAPPGAPTASPPDVTGAPATPASPSTPSLPGAGTSVAGSKGPVPPGTLSPSGTPVNPDGGYVNPDGSHDWMPGYGPQMSFGGQEIKTGRAPTQPDPGDPDSVTGGQRGTPQWRQAYAAHDAWIKSQLDAGLHLADLGLAPTRGGGLSSYMRYGGYQPGGGGTAAAPAQAAPGSPPVAGSGGYLGSPGQPQMNYGSNPLQAAIMQLLQQGGGQ